MNELFPLAVRYLTATWAHYLINHVMMFENDCFIGFITSNGFWFVCLNVFCFSRTFCQCHIVNLLVRLWALAFSSIATELVSCSCSLKIILLQFLYTDGSSNMDAPDKTDAKLHFLSPVSHQPHLLLWFMSALAAHPPSTWLCHKVQAKPAVAGRDQFMRMGTTDRAGFTAPDLCQAHSVAAFLLPLILKWLRCSSQLFWPSPVKAALHSLAHITFLNGYICLHQGLRGLGPAFSFHLKREETI